jgi:hypothetical protein
MMDFIILGYFLDEEFTVQLILKSIECYLQKTCYKIGLVGNFALKRRLRQVPNLELQLQWILIQKWNALAKAEGFLRDGKLKGNDRLCRSGELKG